MESFMTPWNRRVALILLAVGLLSTTGCVYLRLFKTKKQCARFSRYFGVDDKAGLTLSMRRPLLYDKDMRWLGLPATSEEAHGDEQSWKLVFEKLYASEKNEGSNFDMTVFFRFKDRKLKAIHFPEKYLRVLSPQTFIAVFKAFGGAVIDRKNRMVNARIDDTAKDCAVPSKIDLMRLLGKPFASGSESDTESLKYKYRLKPSEGSKTEGKIYWLEFEFDRETGRLLIATVKLRLGSLFVHYPSLDPH